MLKLVEVAAGYHKTNVIQRVNAEFNKGEITAIVGPNGSGKSTLLKAVLGLCESYEGEILLDGRDKSKINRKEFTKQVSYFPQSHTGGAITVSRLVLHGRFPYLGYPRRYGKEDYEYCHQAMEKMGILSLKEKKLDELSGGQRQKVYIAMALAGDMDVYLFDEPTTYLDVRYQLEIMDIMKLLREKGKTVVTVLHDLNYAMQLADQILVMEQGSLAFAGTPERIMEHGILDQVFQVTSKILSDDKGKKYIYFEEGILEKRGGS